jgi:alkyl hydroperoxide reductase subunit D
MESTTLDLIRETIPDYARDLKLNLGSVLTPTGAPGLNERQIWAVALASAIASRNNAFTRAIEAAAASSWTPRTAGGARGRGDHGHEQHLLPLPAPGRGRRVSGMPARLRMNILGNPGIDKLDFELLSLAVSAINGCGLCITSHEKKLRAHGITREMIQSAVRIASVVHAVAGVLEYSSDQGGTVPDAAAA